MILSGRELSVTISESPDDLTCLILMVKGRNKVNTLLKW